MARHKKSTRAIWIVVRDIGEQITRLADEKPASRTVSYRIRRGLGGNE